MSAIPGLLEIICKNKSKSKTKLIDNKLLTLQTAWFMGFPFPEKDNYRHHIHEHHLQQLQMKTMKELLQKRMKIRNESEGKQEQDKEGDSSLEWNRGSCW